MKKLVKFFEGKKRIIGLVILIANAGVRAFVPSLMTPDQHLVIDMVGGAVGGYGAYDVYKRNKIQTK